MLQDLRHSFRDLRKKPGLAITAILSLTLGIGATTAVFSVIYGLLANPYPYHATDRMIHLVLKDDKGEDRWIGITGSQLKQLRQVKCLESVAASWGTWNLTTTGEDLPQDVPSTQLSANAGIHFGVPALLGRTLIPADAPDGQDPQPVVVLSYLFWQRHFNSDPAVVGRTLQLVHKNYTIVGVLPPRFTWDDADVYLPLKITNDTNIEFGPLLRIKPGVTHAAANAELQPLMEQFAKETPAHFPKTFRVQVKGLNDQFVERLGPSLYLLFGAVALLLRWLPEYAVPHEAAIRINVAVLAFSAAIAVITGVMSGLAPAFQFSRPQVAQLIQSSSKRSTGGARGKRTYQVLVAGQIALTLLLLTSAGAAINGFMRLVQTNLGYDPHNIMSVGIPVHQNTHGTWEDRSHCFAQLLARVSAMPEVVSAGISTNATPPSNGNDVSFEIFGRPSGEKEHVRGNWISSEYFTVLRIPLLQGRLWDQTEMSRGAGLAVINQTMARLYWPNGDAVGKQLRLPDVKAEPPFTLASAASDGWLQIVGVVGDARNDGLRKPVKPSVFLPYTQQMRMWTQILVRTRSAPLAALNRVRGEVKAVDPDQQVEGQTRDLEQWIERGEEYAYGRLVALLFGAFSLLALALAAIGLFSVVSYGVARRTNEFGIRMALGATPREVLRLVLQSTAWNVGAGLAAGALLSVMSSGLLRRWAEGSAHSPLMLLAVAALLVTTAALAALIPARRAFAVDPMDALRYE